jgi:hypothetical protein
LVCSLGIVYFPGVSLGFFGTGFNPVIVDINRQTMKKMVVAGLAALFFNLETAAQVFKKGDIVEIRQEDNKERKNISEKASEWIIGRVAALDMNKQEYLLMDADMQPYRVPFIEEQSLLRKPVTRANATASATPSGEYSPSLALLKEKISADFEDDFSDYDSVVVTFHDVQVLDVYRNKDADFGKVDSDVHPFKVDFTVKLVSVNKEGVQKKVNWQFKRQYLLFQNAKGGSELTVVEKEENLLSNI